MFLDVILSHPHFALCKPCGDQRCDRVAECDRRKCIDAADDLFVLLGDGAPGAASQDDVPVSDGAGGAQGVYIWFLLVQGGREYAGRYGGALYRGVILRLRPDVRGTDPDEPCADRCSGQPQAAGGQQERRRGGRRDHFGDGAAVQRGTVYCPA